MRQGRLMAAIAAAAISFFIVVGIASAQYPPPRETLVCAVKQVELKSGESTTLQVTLRDSAGRPLGGQTVSFGVVAGSASLLPASAVTDGAGSASVTVSGIGSGTVTISATTTHAECRATLTVVSIQPPATGNAGLTGNGDMGTALAAAVLTVLSLGISALLLRRSAL